MVDEIDESHIDDIIEIDDEVECVDNRKIWSDSENYSVNLEIGKRYKVTDKMLKYNGDRNGPIVICVDDGYTWHLKSNFKKV